MGTPQSDPKAALDRLLRRKVNGTPGIISSLSLAREMYPESRANASGPRRPHPRHVREAGVFLRQWARNPRAGIFEGYACEETIGKYFSLKVWRQHDNDEIHPDGHNGAVHIRRGDPDNSTVRPGC